MRLGLRIILIPFFGVILWLFANEPWFLAGEAGLIAASSIKQPPFPPAAYYGRIMAAPGFTPSAGMEMTAWIGGNLCGKSQVSLLEGQVVYQIQVLAEDDDHPGCGQIGRTVFINVETQQMEPQTNWDNDRAKGLDLSPFFPTATSTAAPAETHTPTLTATLAMTHTPTPVFNLTVTPTQLPTPTPTVTDNPPLYLVSLPIVSR